MFASILRLTSSDMKKLRITDVYSLHRVVYGLYDDVRTEVEKIKSMPSGILFADKGGDFNVRKILMLSNRQPCQPNTGQLESKIISDKFMQHDKYGFEIIINPTKRDKETGKIVPIRGEHEIQRWFIEKSRQSWGFTVQPSGLQIQNIGVKIFQKESHKVTYGSATLKGELLVTDRAQFIKSFQKGIGRGRAFGFGLMQIVPLYKNEFNF
jgi:CRISPR system Cascade subunit CasE